MLAGHDLICARSVGFHLSFPASHCADPPRDLSFPYPVRSWEKQTSTNRNSRIRSRELKKRKIWNFKSTFGSTFTLICTPLRTIVNFTLYEHQKIDVLLIIRFFFFRDTRLRLSRDNWWPVKIKWFKFFVRFGEIFARDPNSILISRGTKQNSVSVGGGEGREKGGETLIVTVSGSFNLPSL